MRIKHEVSQQFSMTKGLTSITVVEKHQENPGERWKEHTCMTYGKDKVYEVMKIYHIKHNPTIEKEEEMDEFAMFLENKYGPHSDDCDCPECELSDKLEEELKKFTIHDQQGILYYKFDEMQKILTDKEWKDLSNFLYGQTHLPDGVYDGDFERFLIKNISNQK